MPPGPPGGPSPALTKYLENVNRVCREYAKYSRVALASYYRTHHSEYGRFIGIWPVVPLGSSVQMSQRWVLQLGPALRAMRPEAQASGTISQTAAMAEVAVSTLNMASRLHLAGQPRDVMFLARQSTEDGTGPGAAESP